MSITQNEKISQVKNTTLVVGIDISSEMEWYNINRVDKHPKI